MEWLLAGVREPVEESSGKEKTLTLLLSPTNTSLNGVKFTCRVTTTTGKIFQEIITVEIKGMCS